MCADNEGFLYPKITPSLCTECGNCQSACMFTESRVGSLTSPQTYAVKLKDDSKRAQSQSGGAFTALAEQVLSDNGVIYGAAFNDDLSVAHHRIDSLDDLDVLKGSKYVQSSLSDVFVEILRDLRSENFVLFSGTPCQVDAIKRHVELNLAADSKGVLFTCDLVCHGVPSPMVYKEYLAYLSRKHQGTISKFCFRDRSGGWHSHFESFIINSVIRTACVYTTLFYAHIILRPSCHICPYANQNRVGDITIGDCWGIEKVLPKCSDNRGYSLVLLNTTTGEQLFDDVLYKLDCEAINLKDVLQHNLISPSVPSKDRVLFWETMQEQGAEYVFKSTDKQMRPLKRIAFQIGIYGFLRRVMWKASHYLSGR